MKGQPFMQHSILSLHAISGCDTTSRSFNKGKGKFFGVSGEDTEYWEAVDVFEKIYASKVEVVAVGRRILQTIYSTIDERRDNLDLNQIRAARYKDKSIQVAS